MVRKSCKADTPKQTVNEKLNKLGKPKSQEQSEQNTIKNMRSLFVLEDKNKTITGIKTLFEQEDVY